MEPTEETPLIEVLKLGLEKYLDKLQEISSQASKEFALENVSFTFSEQIDIGKKSLCYFCKMLNLRTINYPTFMEKTVNYHIRELETNSSLSY